MVNRTDYDDGWGGGAGPPSRFSFMLFNSVWSLPVLAYVALAPRLHHGLAALGLLAVTALFWFAGAVALAAWLGAPRCASAFCHAVQAAVAFGFLLWALFTALATLAGLAAFRGGARADTTRKPGQPYAGA